MTMSRRQDDSGVELMGKSDSSEASYAYALADRSQRQGDYNSYRIEELEARVEKLETYVDYLATIIDVLTDPEEIDIAVQMALSDINSWHPGARDD